MALGPAHALAALLLEHPNLRAARLAVDDADDLDVGHERRPREHFAAVLLEEQHAVDGDFLARPRVDAVEGDHGARRDLDLAAAALNDCEHALPLLAGARQNSRDNTGPWCFCANRNSGARSACGPATTVAVRPGALLEQDAGAADFLRAERAQEARNQAGPSARNTRTAPACSAARCTGSPRGTFRSRGSRRCGRR